MRSGVDFYIEAPDDTGGFVRLDELPDLIRVAAPVYVKLGLRDAPHIYPSGSHLEATAIAPGRERVRRAQLALELLDRSGSTTRMSKQGAADLARTIDALDASGIGDQREPRRAGTDGVIS